MSDVDDPRFAWNDADERQFHAHVDATTARSWPRRLYAEAVNLWVGRSWRLRWRPSTLNDKEPS